MVFRTVCEKARLMACCCTPEYRPELAAAGPACILPITIRAAYIAHVHSFAYLSRFIQEFFEISARRARKTHDHFVPRFRNVWNYAQQLDDRRMVTLPHDSNLKMHHGPASSMLSLRQTRLSA